MSRDESLARSRGCVRRSGSRSSIGAVALIDSEYAIVIAALVAIAHRRDPKRARRCASSVLRGRARSCARSRSASRSAFVLLPFSKLLLTPIAEALTGIPRDLSAFDFVRGDVAAYLGLMPKIWIGAAICEEIIFRGFLIGRIEVAFGGASRATTGCRGRCCRASCSARRTRIRDRPACSITGVLGLDLRDHVYRVRPQSLDQHPRARRLRHAEPRARADQLRSRIHRDRRTGSFD